MLVMMSYCAHYDVMVCVYMYVYKQFKGSIFCNFDDFYCVS